MRGFTMRRHLLLAFAAVLVLGLGLTALYGDRAARDVIQHALADQLTAEARLFAHFSADDIAAWRPGARPDAPAAAMAARCRDANAVSDAYYAVLTGRGELLAWEGGADDRGYSLADRPDVAEAMAGRVGFTFGVSPALGHTRVSVSLPRENAVGDGLIVRVGRAVDDPTQWLGLWRRRQAVGIGFAVVAALAVVVFWSRRITRPMQRLGEGARRFAGGDFATPIPVAGVREVRDVADAFNAMARELSARIEAVKRQQAAHVAVLASITEALMSVSYDMRVLGINPAAERLFGYTNAQATWMPLARFTDNAALVDFARAALAATPDAPVSADIAFGPDGARILRVNGTHLAADSFGRPGAILVLSDVTRDRRAELMRRDFVDNAAHELRTPVTAIRGYAETLLDEAERLVADNPAIAGILAYDPAPANGEPPAAPVTPEEWCAFLGVIVRHAARLERLTADLLLLARLESPVPVDGPSSAPCPMDDLTAIAVEPLRDRIDALRLRVVTDVAAMPAPRGVRRLLEIALGNVLDNAVKFSPPGGTIRVAGGVDPDDARLYRWTVEDDGPGIAPAHRAHVFNRFYRVNGDERDASAGTGLGLPIVRHILRAHGGTVVAGASPSGGASFAIRLPLG